MKQKQGAYTMSTRALGAYFIKWGNTHHNPYDTAFGKWLLTFGGLKLVVFNGKTAPNRGVIFEGIVKSLLGVGNASDTSHSIDIPQYGYEVKFISPKSKASSCGCHEGTKAVIVGVCNRDGVKILKVSVKAWESGNIEGEEFRA
jgi:hypothetical protein